MEYMLKLVFHHESCNTRITGLAWIDATETMSGYKCGRVASSGCNWSGWRCNVTVVLAEDPVEEHGQPHSPLRDPPRHDREPRIEVVVCESESPVSSAAVCIQIVEMHSHLLPKLTG